MNYSIFVLGCQMNLSDAERLAAFLDQKGFKQVEEKDADVIFVVACSVRQSAVDRIWGKIRLWQEDKKKVFLTGCVLPADQKKFAKKGIKFFDIKELNKIVLTDVRTIKNYSLGRESEEKFDYFFTQPKRSAKIAYVTIMTGCDNFCSYCAVPYTRGQEVSRPMDDVVDEVKDALAKGYKEIMLLGQNVNSYGKLKTKNAKLKASTKSVKDNKNFIKLLTAIDNLPGNFKFNFISSNPHDMGDELIKIFAHLKKWPRELHLAMQSGDDEILKMMNRKYTTDQYLKLIENLKLKIENLTLTTDIIVGFPGETKKQFENTVEVCKKIGFEKAYIGQYSTRTGTAAAKLEDSVGKEEKKRRWLELEELINR